ncbi:DsbA family protein [Oceanicella sp. SM1341]|uniref:DsbA family protein n=1 Tax=Oceanicella sp. SM1341 TaxID=1548889 RepID=UPI000E4AD5A6|nr:DsbA family protein [Oceanicella sp. SM1341]
MTDTARRRLLALAALAPLAGALPAFAQAQSTGDAAPAAPGEDKRLMEMTMGSADAPVEMIEYASLTCPHCAHFHEEVLPQLKADYIDTGKVRLVFREVYFDRFGLWATMVARCGGPLRYFGIVGEMYRTQREWTQGADDAAIAANLRKIGKVSGLTDEEMNACLGDQDFANALVERYRQQASDDGIDATPTFIIDGEKVSNRSYEEFRKILDDKLG